VASQLDQFLKEDAADPKRTLLYKTRPLKQVVVGV